MPLILRSRWPLSHPLLLDDGCVNGKEERGPPGEEGWLVAILARGASLGPAGEKNPGQWPWTDTSFRMGIP